MLYLLLKYRVKLWENVRLLQLSYYVHNAFPWLLMPQSPHRLRNDLKCVEWDVKPYTTNQPTLAPETARMRFWQWPNPGPAGAAYSTLPGTLQCI